MKKKQTVCRHFHVDSRVVRVFYFDFKFLDGNFKLNCYCITFDVLYFFIYRCSASAVIDSTSIGCIIRLDRG